MKAAVEFDFLESISPFCMHEGTKTLKAVSAALAWSRWQAGTSTPNKFSHYCLWKDASSFEGLLEQIQAKANSSPVLAQ